MMFTLRSFFVLLISCTALQLQAQQAPGPPIPDTSLPKPPQPIKYNAGFDVIITINGEIIYGLVKEVDEVFVKYQRTDIPDGPIYTIRRNEVYAISYRNQVKDYLTPVYNLPGSMKPIPAEPLPGYDLQDSVVIKTPQFRINRRANARIGLGFIKGFSKVDNADQLSNTATFPIISIAYDVQYNAAVKMGVMLSFGSRKFSGQRFSSYDSTNISSDIVENIFSLMVYGKYAINNSYTNLRPYILGGIGINSSNINTQNEIRFTNNSQVLKVNSGGRSTGLGIIARVGADYFFNQQIGAYADVGVGAAIVQVGAIFNLNY